MAEAVPQKGPPADLAREVYLQKLQVLASKVKPPAAKAEALAQSIGQALDRRTPAETPVMSAAHALGIRDHEHEC